ncbi:MAG TPA: outer membrane protein transport protein [Casimicrobiaceae bacterium]|nr:outer membrane protein transport protein [Casimicrobiaceae bacterium]
MKATRSMLLPMALGVVLTSPDVAGQAQLPGYGQAASGMGGAAIAVPYDAEATANNAAGMAFVGSRADFTFTLIRTKATTDFGPFHGSADDYGFGPGGGINWDLQNGWTVGMSLFGFGSGIDYKKPFPGGTSSAGSTIAQVVVAPTVTYRVAPQHAVGLAVLLAGQRIKIEGLQGFGFQDAGSDHSFGAGASIGYLGDLGHGVKIGLTYSSKIDMGRLDKYQDLLADRGNLDIPQQAGVGLSWQATPHFLVALDYLWINWASVSPLGNPFPGSGPPGSAGGPGFGWRNQDVYRLGVAFDAGERWTLRAGGTYKSRLVVPESTTLDTLSPLIPQVSMTIGASYRITDKQVVSGAYAHNFEKSITGTQASSGVNMTSSANFFSVGYGYRF